MLRQAYLSAEDNDFFSHGGVDYVGIGSAVLDNLTSDGRSRGASTITQQVAKNLLLTNEQSYTRKVKEALLAYRIESYLSKEEILTLLSPPLVRLHGRFLRKGEKKERERKSREDRLRRLS